ncbi:glycosyltransferase involved in cell wall biosynthesis [Anoxybacillus voinovskiensis]|uniref:Glycosyltransferase involved in cell wall biosynthesis n=1 Tax=Anoxybacteroides voinovskiense TaxID=230470 RepID=A0A840DLM7_9BACL|nr:glycosyltransferase [Anoxybacillus voinovskiensis]MBB4073780.1 glycosyltransferase involved in cell wall biosynthesis [Anoxybacillus voinovskiensis]GGJ63954.1 capsular polysaccharide biosynthesis protein [Anoxybacillus voinovskiensis]
MKVALLAPSKSIHTHKWALFYQQQGIDVKVITFKDHYSPENAKEVETWVLPKWFPGKFSYISSVFALKKQLASFQPDILHAHYVSSYGFVGALANYHPFYVSVWGRDIYQFPQQHAINRTIVEFTLKKADVICSTSHVMAVETKKYTNKPVEVTPFGVDLSIFRPMERQKKDTVTIGTVKALSDKYGIADLIKAFAMIHQQYPNTNLLIVGDGPQRQEYEQLVETLGICHVTTFTGRVPNTEVPNYINQMDIFAVPSTEDSESFGVAAVEAMACGVPVVVSNVGGLPEVVKKDITGLIVPKENPEALAAAFQKLLGDTDLRHRMGRNGIQHVKEHYDWIDNANGMLKLYEKTLNGV